MASINQLKEVTQEPATLEEWLDGFDEQDRRTVVSAVLRGSTAQVFPIISQLEDNPYPFKRSTLNHHRRIMRGEQ